MIRVTPATLPAGLSLSSGGVLSGTATVNGGFSFTVTATDAMSYTGSQAHNLVVDTRPDPTLDPSVADAISAQVGAMQRLAFTQIQNVNNRLEQLRGCHATSVSLQVQAEGQGGFGAGHDSVEPGNDASNTGDGYSFIGYGAWSVAGPLRLEGLLGYGSASLLSERTTSFDGQRVEGKRDASQVFGSLTLAGDLLRGRFSLQPYLRANYQSAGLQSYDERGDGSLSLHYQAADSDSTQYLGGLRGVWSLPVPLGLLQPMLRLEYQRLDGIEVRQSISYVDGIGGRYLLTLKEPGSDSGVMGFGLGFSSTGRVEGMVEYQTGFGSEDAAESLFTADLSWGF